MTKKNYEIEFFFFKKVFVIIFVQLMIMLLDNLKISIIKYVTFKFLKNS